MKHTHRQHSSSLCAAACVALAAIGLSSAGSAHAAAEGIALAPHRAVYEMSLAASRGGSGVTQVVGRMVYELTGSVCEGYTQNMRFVTSMVNQSGNSVLTDLRTWSWEDAASKHFRFTSNQYRDDKTSEATAGDATRAPAGDDVKVELTKPGKKDLTLRSGVYFPMQHSIALLEAARSGKAFFRADLFDGSEKGEKVYDTITAIGHKQAAGNKRLPVVKEAERLNSMAAWPVSIGYFESGSGKEDALPVYELSFLFFENGVSRKLFIDYGEFDMQGEIKEMVFLEPGKCEPGKR